MFGETDRRWYSFSNSCLTSAGSALNTLMSTCEKAGRSAGTVTEDFVGSISSITISGMSPCDDGGCTRISGAVANSTFDEPPAAGLNCSIACPGWIVVLPDGLSSFWIWTPIPRRSLGSKLNDRSKRQAWSPITFSSLVARPPGPISGLCLLNRSQRPWPRN